MSTPRLVAVIVEGPTEEALVQRVLAPRALVHDTSLQAIVVTNSSTPRGAVRGGGGWKHYDRLLRPLLAQPHWHRVGLLIDYYGYPHGAPGREADGRAEDRQAAMCTDLTSRYGSTATFRPLVVLHEIEALVLAAVDAGAGTGSIDRVARERLVRAIRQAGGPEHVNGGRDTCPSRRLVHAVPSYSKTTTGPDLIEEAGLDAVLTRCPTFAAWWADLLA